MFELFFIIMLEDGTGFRERFDNQYSSIVQCQNDGWSKADKYKEQIVKKYPNITSFDIECKGFVPEGKVVT